MPVYEGMVIGQTPKREDIAINACKRKKLTNTRASGSDDALRLIPPKQMSLEQCLEFLTTTSCWRSPLRTCASASAS